MCQGATLISRLNTSLSFTSMCRCTQLHYTATDWIPPHFTALQCTALHCTAVHSTARRYTALHYTALHCTVLHCTAVHCTALHCILPASEKSSQRVRCLCCCSSQWKSNIIEHSAVHFYVVLVMHFSAVQCTLSMETQDLYIVSVLGQDKGYTVKYTLLYFFVKSDIRLKPLSV